MVPCSIITLQNDCRWLPCSIFELRERDRVSAAFIIANISCSNKDTIMRNKMIACLTRNNIQLRHQILLTVSSFLAPVKLARAINNSLASISPDRTFWTSLHIGCLVRPAEPHRTQCNLSHQTLSCPEFTIFYELVSFDDFGRPRLRGDCYNVGKACSSDTGLQTGERLISELPMMIYDEPQIYGHLRVPSL